MKKTLFLGLLAVTGLFSSCDPLENVYDELDSKTVDKAKYTLTTDDYKALAGKTGVESYVSTAYYFKTEDEAAGIIPLVLNAGIPNAEEGDEVSVYYNQYIFAYSASGASATNGVTERVSYTLGDADYALGGTTFKNFDRWSQIEAFLKAKYPDNKEGRLATLTFTWFNTNTNPTSKTLTDTYFYKNGQWFDTYLVSAEEYTSVDRGRFNNFITADQALLPDYFNKFLKAKIVGPKVNDIQFVSFANRPATTTTQDVMAMVYDGQNWVPVTKTITIPAFIKFVRKGDVWVADRTIDYTLVTADYQAIGDDVNIGTAANRANLKSFNNFYQVGNGTDTRYWTDAQIQAGIANRLKTLFPNAAVAQKYKVSFVKYTGSNTTIPWTFEKKDSGNYEYVPTVQ